MNKKITLKAFFDSEKSLAIHCDSEWKAKQLLRAFHKMGMHWRDGKSYLDKSYWEVYYEKTCYSNNGRFEELDWVTEHFDAVYEFEDVYLPNDEDIATAMAELKRTINSAYDLTSVKKVFDILGVEPNEEFKIKHNDYTYVPHYKIDEELHVWIAGSYWLRSGINLADFIVGTYKIIKLTKKKKLRDLTLEDYKKYYKYCNCLECDKCPFKIIQCWPEIRNCWIYNKSIFKAEFLDQEVEIPIETEEENE